MLVLETKQTNNLQKKYPKPETKFKVYGKGLHCYKTLKSTIQRSSMHCECFRAISLYKRSLFYHRRKKSVYL